MSQEKRFTAWFSNKERAALEADAERQHTSMNYILRTIVRKHYRLDSKRKRSTREPTSVH